MRMIVFIFILATISLQGQQKYWKFVGPKGGIITTLTQSPAGDIYAGTDRNGIFRSTDSGNSWENIGPAIGVKPDSQFVGFIGAVNSISVRNNDEIYVGCYNGIFRTRDYGKNWKWLDAGYYLYLNFECYCIIALPNNIVVAGTNIGNLRSTDNGENWEIIMPYFKKPNFKTLCVGNDGTLYAGIKSVTEISIDIWKSTDNGENWNMHLMLNPKSQLNSIIVDSYNNMIVGTEGGVYKTNTPQGGLRELAINTPSPSAVNSVCMDNQGNIFAGTNTGVFRYYGKFINNDFINWSEKDRGFNSSQPKINYLLTLKNGEILAATDDGLFKTVDSGENWFESDSGLGSINYTISEIIFNNLGHVFVGTEWGGIYRSMDNGTTWKCVSEGKTLSVIYSLACNNNGDIYAGTLGGGYAFYKSTDNGETWLDLGLSDFFIRSIACNSKGHIFIGTSSGGILRSTNNGNTWDKINSYPASTDIRLGINSQDQIFASGREGYAATLYRSIDYGNTWLKLFEEAASVIYDIAFGQNQTLYITSGTAFKSTDNGNSWKMTHSDDNYFVYTLTANSLGDVFLGLTNPGGIRHSLDTGETWKYENSGLSNLWVKSIACSPNGYIFAGTEGGVFRTLNSTTSISNLERIPDLYSLEQNFPNPFNPNTKIFFSLNRGSQIVLTVYDAMGKEIKELIREYLNAGKYEVIFDGRKLSSGIYFYRLLVGLKSSTRKMLLLK
ncbi:MAG: T9SS type A sorting domain-containing protein [Ignavibacteriales bacterium]|nr:T9SS type A sorting domain-containing protein [Ignavibacteriales bacterium]